MESDQGLDYLSDIEKKILCKEDFLYFHVKKILYLIQYLAISEQETWLYVNYPDEAHDAYTYYYEIANMLVAECLTEYIQKGFYQVTLFDKDGEPYHKEIKILVCTKEELGKIIHDLKETLKPGRPLYESWEETTTWGDGNRNFQKWQNHVNSLVDQLSTYLATM